jgi:CRP-like cAMP-binding protein
VKLIRADSKGIALAVGWRSAPWLVGAISALTDLPHPVSAETATECVLRPVGSGEFRRLASSDIQICRWALGMLADESYRQMLLLGELGSLGLRERLEHLLARLIADGHTRLVNGAIRLTMPVQRQDLAQMIGTSPAQLSRLLAELEIAGVVARAEGWLTIPPASPLRRLLPAIGPSGHAALPETDR